MSGGRFQEIREKEHISGMYDRAVELSYEVPEEFEYRRNNSVQVYRYIKTILREGDPA